MSIKERPRKAATVRNGPRLHIKYHLSLKTKDIVEKGWAPMGGYQVKNSNPGYSGGYIDSNLSFLH